MSYESTIETALEELQATNSASAIAASIAWSYAVSMANLLTLSQRIGDSDDVEYVPQQDNDTRYEERLAIIEKRVDEAADIVSWMSSYVTNPDLLPTGAKVTELLGKPGGPEMDEDALLDMLMTAFEVDKAEAKAVMHRSAAQQKQRRILQAAAVNRFAEYVGARVDAALAVDVDASFVISRDNAIRIIDKMAEKTDQHAARRMERAAQTGRKRRLAQLAAEHRLLTAVRDKLDDALALVENDGVEADEAEEAIH